MVSKTTAKITFALVVLAALVFVVGFVYMGVFGYIFFGLTIEQAIFIQLIMTTTGAWGAFFAS